MDMIRKRVLAKKEGKCQSGDTCNHDKDDDKDNDNADDGDGDNDDDNDGDPVEGGSNEGRKVSIRLI